VVLYPFSVWYVCKLDYSFDLALKLGVTAAIRGTLPGRYERNQ
jgi:hypothetical protein